MREHGGHRDGEHARERRARDQRQGRIAGADGSRADGERIADIEDAVTCSATHTTTASTQGQCPVCRHGRRTHGGQTSGWAGRQQHTDRERAGRVRERASGWRVQDVADERAAGVSVDKRRTSGQAGEQVGERAGERAQERAGE
ncbi:uncharacterized protein B0H18DRAFT_1214054 [Fomitopsis serialis]|uniref:uncharacterized protein n=1 Tax=Fomitopsis serialis TaxID=139415 RepID=UPI00200785ED|nr:uncharacterized protein B0H18DRAFT_1214054 [Neoantrodia serialis]KAH9918827.1 hypothetical protein B0H18DRAFT_1214054 [Neoantrodia serialis]